MNKKNWIVLAAVCCLVATFVTVFLFRDQAAPATEKVISENKAEPKDEEGFVEKGPGKRDDWFMTQKGYEEDVIPRDAFRKATEQAKKLKATTASEAPGALNQEWKFNAPSNIGGRVVDVAVDPKQHDTIYIAAASGGVWKSTDAGNTFETAWDDDNSQAMGALAVSSEGTLFAGTGEANPGGGSIVYGGTGIFKSTDGGMNWVPTGLKESGSIGRIAIDPVNPNRIYVAATGPLFHDGGERGLYRSTDGGKTWDLVLEGENATTGAVDIAIDPNNPETLYAAMWDRIRYPNKRQYGGEGSAIYRSKDGGDSWTKLKEGLPAGEKGRIGIAVSTSDSNRVYATVVKPDGYFEGFYTSDNGGDSWIKAPYHKDLANSQSSFGWWFGRNYVDPNDGNHIFVTGVELMESTDGGKTWAKISTRAVHADQHTMAWDAKQPGRVYLGNDGGVYRSEDNGSVTKGWVKATYEPYTQFYTMDISQQDSSRISGGTQDNGSNRSWGRDGWNNYYGGDGLTNLINYENKDIVYACYQYGNCAWSEDGGNTMKSFTKNTVSERRNWLTPIVFDPNDPSIMYYGGNMLNRSVDGGRTWQAISPSLSDAVSQDAYPYGTITTIAVAKSNGGVIYAGTDDGKLWTTKDLGKKWTELKDKNLPVRWVTRVAVDPKDESLVYATFSGFRSGDNTAHVMQSKDGGKTWKDISGNLPDVPVNDIIVNPKNRHTLYIATDVGVFVSPNGGKKWYSLGEGIPMIAVTDISYHEATGVLYAATFGRGIYNVKLTGW
ncbi:WD40/YVTN/BNR-like repeat-containing protein [Bacillus sp. T33-2]|uniref:WD40/YVTN/BNR-like repeat-containing protein n=1 Tax=Bacillus sp. T33-2 TaxID=2054168 RepID=UPI000C7703C0|nr:sialidase family protein [Bacillus sp. T33-2]PLR95962.1 glycosyl hydrolase [Bacillus sp. T33-2]